ncbi:MAG: ParB/RepB/Spo0J family partition protein [Gammaproteobacteria bacterium AqS3]|nr:ParB/RepB/Spo0J family partition protein [Gammaproteobacteria bacterium AqS3]
MSGKRRRLGRGLDALLGQVGEQPVAAAGEDRGEQAKPPSEVGQEVLELPLDEVRPSPYQPRDNFDADALNELAQAIRTHGVLQPILVRPLIEGGYELIAGERRLRAGRLAGLDTIPAISRPIDEAQAMAVALIENVQREDLHPLERAASFLRLIEECGYTHGELGEILGISRASVTNALRLLKLPQDVRDRFMAGTLEMGHARALSGLKNAKQQSALTQRIIQDGLSVRQTEQEVQRLNRKSGAKDRDRGRKPASTRSRASADIKRLEQSLGEHLGLPVRIFAGQRGGRLEVRFGGNDEFEGLLQRIGLVGADETSD